MILTKNDKKRIALEKALVKTGGYCPCMIEQNEDTMCPCKWQREDDECICGLYEKVEE